MMSRRAILPTAAAVLLAARVARAQGVSATTDDAVKNAIAQLDSIATQALQKTGVPGMAVAVVYRDTVQYIRGFGVREAGKPDPVDGNTMFALASVSKPVASTVVAALVGDGVVSWDDPIIKHNPGFAMYDPWVTREVTLRDLFAHRSGLPGHAGDLLEDIGYDRDEVLYRLRYQRPDSSFRAQYAYTNFGLTAAAVAAAKASGKSWEDLSRERLYEKLGMWNTSSAFADFSAAANRAHEHVKLGGNWVPKYTRDPDAQSPAGGVVSSVRDMTAWVRLQLARGRFGGEEIVSEAALDETHRPQIVSSPPQNPTSDHAGFYGLGWNVGYDKQGRVRLSHSGAFNLGAATVATLYPAQGLGFIALTNAQPIGLPEAVGESFFDLVFNGTMTRDWLAFLQDVFAKLMAPDYGTGIDYTKPPASAAPALPPASYTGTYTNTLYGDAAIVAAGESLALKLGPRQDAFALTHFDRDVFTYQPVGENAYGPAAVTFTVAADGKASAVVIENLDRNGQGTFRHKAGPA
jgi:CubicO group peptidase (beta-lactamase class C family)